MTKIFGTSHKPVYDTHAVTESEGVIFVLVSLLGSETGFATVDTMRAAQKSGRRTPIENEQPAEGRGAKVVEP